MYDELSLVFLFCFRNPSHYTNTVAHATTKYTSWSRARHCRPSPEFNDRTSRRITARVCVESSRGRRLLFVYINRTRTHRRNTMRFYAADNNFHVDHDVYTPRDITTDCARRSRGFFSVRFIRYTRAHSVNTSPPAPFSDVRAFILTNKPDSPRPFLLTSTWIRTHVGHEIATADANCNRNGTTSTTYIVACLMRIRKLHLRVRSWHPQIL